MSLPVRLLSLLVASLAALALGLQPVPSPAEADGSVGSAGAAGAASAASSRSARTPNIVVVMADDMRVDDLDFAPRIRRLVGRGGVTFANSFSPYPLCCPARASFLTGTYAHNHGVYWHLKPYGYGAFDDSRTLATSLSAAGYRTSFIGKYLNGYGLDRSKVARRPSLRYVPRGWDDWIASVDGLRGARGGTYNYFNTPYNRNGRLDRSHKGEYQTDTLGRFATRLVRRHARRRAPFFLYLSFVAPHHGGPREADDPRPVRSGRRRDTFVTPARPGWVKGRFDRLVTRPSGMPRRGPAEADVSDKPVFFRSIPELSRRGKRALTEVTRQRAEAIYVMDRQVGRLVTSLKKTGQWADTVLLFTSDNGYFLGEHRQRQGKVRAHEPSLRVPLLVTGPGMRDGSTRYDPITTVDLTATLLEIAGARPPHPGDGTSRWTTMRQGDQGWTAPVVTESTHSAGGRRSGFSPRRSDPRTSIGVRTPRWSLSLHRNGESELYDLLKDPAQLENVYGDRAHAAVRDQLLEVWRRAKDCAGTQCAAPLPAELQAGPAELRTLTQQYWREIDRRYGR